MATQGQVRSTSRGRSMLRIFSVLSLTIFSVGLMALTLAMARVPVDDSGAVFSGDRVTAIARGSQAERAGLRVGDRLAPATSFFDRLVIGWPDHVAGGQTYTFNVIRGGVEHAIRLHIPKRPNDTVDFLQYGIGLIAFLSFVIVGTFLVLNRPSPLTWAFFLFCVANPVSKWFGAIDALLSLPMPLGFVLNMARTTLLLVGYIAFIYFALCFPGMRAYGWRARAVRALPWLFLISLAFDYYDWFSQFYVSNPSWLAYVEECLPVTYATLSTASLVGTYRGSSAQDKHRLAWVILGTLVGYTAILLRDTIENILPAGDWRWVFITFQALFTFAPLALGYGILRYRVIDVRFVVNRAVVYTAVTAILVIVFESFSWLIERVLQQTRAVEILQFVVAIAIGISLQHSFKRIEATVNRWFFQSVHEAQEHLSRIAATLLSAESHGALERTLVTEPVSVLKLTAGALFRRHPGGKFERTAALGWFDEDNSHFDPDDPLVLYLQDRHGAVSLSDWKFSESYMAAKTKCADEAVPIFSQGALTAIALYGPHANGTRVDPTERSALANLALAAEQAYDSLHTRSENVRRLSELLERVDKTAAYNDFDRYLADQVIQTVPERARTALVACAVIPQPTAEDVIYATGDENDVERLQQLLSGSAIIRLAPDGSYALHPLIHHVLAKEAGGVRQDLLVRCARAWQKVHRHERAAELYTAAGIPKDVTGAAVGTK